MSTETEDLIEICEQLPQIQREELADFARFLLSKYDDVAWERLIADPTPRPKLDEFVQKALAEGSEPLDPDSIGRDKP